MWCRLSQSGGFHSRLCAPYNSPFSERRQRSATFAYRDSFLEAGDTLLWLLRADREANFLMHIEAVKETVPCFVLAGRTNCARYTPVYAAEMQQLDEKQPLMHRHMIEGGFVVRRSKSRVFICMPTAQALEQMRILAKSVPRSIQPR